VEQRPQAEAVGHNRKVPAASRRGRDRRHQVVSKSMVDGNPQHYQTEGALQGKNLQVIASAAETWRLLAKRHHFLPPVFSLAHLARLSGTRYQFLRRVVGRREPEPYRVFVIRKRPEPQGAMRVKRGLLRRRYRTICVPAYELLRVQTWIARRILRDIPMHEASTAYGKGANVYNGAAVHAGCHWLVKTDVREFFESISEISVYSVFRSLGYQPLISFEMARLCTRVGRLTPRKMRKRWIIRHPGERGHVAYSLVRTDGGGGAYQPYEHLGPSDVRLITNLRAGESTDWSRLPNVARLGHLPQGAPSSPMLANLAVRALDEELLALAGATGCRYTRYADDITFSTARRDFSRETGIGLVGQIYRLLSRHGLSPNTAKTEIRGPGDRRIVLGLLVNKGQPRLVRDFRERMRMHLYYLHKHGPAEHARKRGFRTVFGLRRHLEGLVSYACQIDGNLGPKYKEALARVPWPV
jgi:RNA-directed DNA polymerase